MRGIWKAISSGGRYEALAHHGDLPLPVVICPLKSARCFRLRFDEARGRLKLTCPARTSRRAALAWAAEQREWVEDQLTRALPGEPLMIGAVIPFDGREMRLDWRSGNPRTPRFEGDQIVCGGPSEGFARRIESFLKRQALDTLSAETAHYSAIAGVSPKSISIGDADTRWGSCSSDGRIRFSWRLILAPPEVRRYVVAHEVAHLRYLNHGAEFRALEERLTGGDVARAKALLRRLGPRLKRIGRGGL